MGVLDPKPGDSDLMLTLKGSIAQRPIETREIHQAPLLKRIVELEGELELARVMLWETHPCEGKYGDDGELQCGACYLDFKRQPIYEIRDRENRLGREKLARAREAGL